LVWHYPDTWQGQDGSGIKFFSALMQADWKLVYNMPTQKNELYKLTKEIDEQNDAAIQ